MLTKKDLQNRMYYKAPDAQAVKAHKKVQDAAFAFAEVLVETCPNPSRELTLAIEKIEEARMWGSAAIAHNSMNLCQCGRGYDTDRDGDCPSCASNH